MVNHLFEYKTSFFKLGDCCKLEKGITPIQKAVPGDYPLVVTTAERKTANTYQFDEPSVCIPLISSRGHGVACLNQLYYQEGRFALGNILCAATPMEPDKLCAKFLYYYLNHKKDSAIVPLMRGGANVSLTVDSLKGINIPIPPIEIQKRIIEVLDTFEALSNNLLAELSARRIQYEYYSNSLLNFPNARYYSLGELCEIVDYRGKTPKKSDEGIFLVTAKNIRQGYIDYEKSKEYIPADTYDEVMHRGLPKIGDVLITTEAPCGYVAQVDREDIALAQRVIKYRPKNSEQLDSTFLKFILLGREFQDKLEKEATGGTVKGIKGSTLHTMTIPIPDIMMQRKVVDILSKFECLSHSASDGIPAEIDARKKQYDYYRDSLLSFGKRGEEL